MRLFVFVMTRVAPVTVPLFVLSVPCTVVCLKLTHFWYPYFLENVSVLRILPVFSVFSVQIFEKFRKFQKWSICRFVQCVVTPEITLDQTFTFGNPFFIEPYITSDHLMDPYAAEVTDLRIGVCPNSQKSHGCPNSDSDVDPR